LDLIGYPSDFKTSDPLLWWVRKLDSDRILLADEILSYPIGFLVEFIHLRLSGAQDGVKEKASITF
jgi:hypothetical protein